ncbi:MAG: DUF5943 domain-containing protein [Betaproteobacteria bacterium]
MRPPQLPLDVDPATGVWRADGSPVILVPRHFLMGTYKAFAEALGTEGYSRAIDTAGRAAARSWCMQQAEHYGLQGIAVLEHYLARISQRGWGQFRLLEHDLMAGTARVELRHSAFVLTAEPADHAKQCAVFESWIAAGLEVCCEESGMPKKLSAREVQCAGDRHAPHCEFDVAPV